MVSPFITVRESFSGCIQKVSFCILTTYCNIVLIKVSMKSRVTHIVTTVSVCISKSFSKDDLIFERTRTLWKLQREYKLYKRIWPKLSPFNDSSIENAHIGHSSEVRGLCLMKWPSKMFYRKIWKLKILRKLWKWAVYIRFSFFRGKLVN